MKCLTSGSLGEPQKRSGALQGGTKLVAGNITKFEGKSFGLSPLLLVFDEVYYVS